ncbi:hypothetical protein [Fulvimonas soli]|jgi:hypothetical protein|uniref:DUF3137 domain-containing protein n=1 Tax=Fulvimonas soli TaxID=155197 RepID=A0A316HRJ5_9GAMM|nr:hypothetical protein [Fulvimonas soli]PWK83881.1 hypothetical protein C7456_11228 [Fulvimonas soli]TNY25044.1 hypothetical protein BV497_15965 [Fulvimonas soli]
MERFVVYLPRWLRWTLLAALALLVAGFSVAFFLGINRPGFKDWLPASVSVVQIALTALAYVLLVFFTESGQNPAALQRRTEQVLTGLLPRTLARVTDVQGAPAAVTVGAPSGVIGYDYTLRTANAELRAWIGLNVHRVIVILFCAWPEGMEEQAFLERLRAGFADTLGGARAIGYDEPHFQAEAIDGCRFASIWLTWDIGTQEDFLTHSPSQLFFAQDVALMLQSFLRTAQRRGLRLSTALAPTPL